MAAALLSACFAEEEDPTVKTFYGERTHLDEHGNNIHPFLGQSRVEMAIYPDVGAISVRLTPHELKQGEPMPLRHAVGDTFSTFTNWSNYYYTAPVYLGASRSPFVLLYDTGSPEMTLDITTCTGCLAPKWDCAANAATCTLLSEPRSISYYGGQTLTGNRCTNTVSPIDNDAG